MLKLLSELAVKIGVTRTISSSLETSENVSSSAFLFIYVSLILKIPLKLSFILETKLLKNKKHQTRVSLLLELVSDAYLTANRTRYIWSSTQETTPLDHASPTTTRSQAAGNNSWLCRARNTQNPLCDKTKAAPHDRDLPDKR